MKHILLILALLLPGAAFADKNAPMLYSRTNILVARKAAPAALPWQQRLVLDVEVRDGMGLYNRRGWFDMSGYPEKTGVLMTFAEPGVQPIVRMTQYAPVDILFIDKQGKITQIAPNLTLADLEQDIYPDAPVLAFLFLKGGACASLSINPGDDIEYALFKKPPAMLSAPGNTGSIAPINTAPVTPVTERILK